MNVQRDTVITISKDVKTSLADFLHANEKWNEGLLRMKAEAEKYQKFIKLIGEL